MTPSFDTLPFTIIIDTREQAPYQFAGHKCQRASGSPIIPLLVTTTTHKLDTGDYSIEGMEDRVCVERKSLDDALGTFTTGRDRFERELERMEEFEAAAVVLEFEWNALLRLGANDGRNVNGRSIDGSLIAWSQRFKRVKFFHRPTRQHGQEFVLHYLARFWNDRVEECAGRERARRIL